MPLDIYPPATITTTRSWVQLGSTTANNTASTITFSSLAAYPFYRIVFNSLQLASTSSFRMRINNDNTGTHTYNYSASGSAVGANLSTLITFPNGLLSNLSGEFLFESTALYPIYTFFAVTNSGEPALNGRGIWLATTQINRFDFFNSNSLNFTSGSIIVYGSN